MDNLYIIKQNISRYGDIAGEFPAEIKVTCTEIKALKLAHYLCEYFPRCDYIFYVEDVE